VPEFSAGFASVPGSLGMAILRQEHDRFPSIIAQTLAARAVALYVSRIGIHMPYLATIASTRGHVA
jgi:hypothetical protein